MTAIARYIKNLNKGFVVVGGFCLLMACFLVTANVISRLFNYVIPGSYEVTELLIVIVVSGALGYAAAEGSHVTVRILVERLPHTISRYIHSLMLLISGGVWGAMAYVGYDVLVTKGLGEKTDVLDISFLPFRIIWSVGLSVLCLMYIVEVFTTWCKDEAK